MGSLCWKGFALVFVLYLADHICAAAVIETDCDPTNTDATKGGAAVCEAVNSNTECPDRTTKCACKAGYKQDANNDNTCVAVLEGTCTSNDDCTGTVTNSECSQQKCKCTANYIADRHICKKALGKQCTDADDCVTNAKCETTCKCSSGFLNTAGLCAVSETTCDSAKNDALTGASTVCEALDANSECPDGTTKCVCKAGYKHGATNGNTCVAVLAGACSTNGDCTGEVPYSECSSNTCSCVTGFKTENNLCTKAVSDTLCSPGTNDQAGASAVCKAVDANAECKAGASACSCKTGYKEGSKDSNTCVLKPVSETACQPSNNDPKTGGTAVCTAVDANAECKTGASACSCKSGYKDGSQDTHACVLISVAETDCDPSDDDGTTGGAAVCKAVDTNAECPDSTRKCACKAGYKQDATSVNTCVTDPGSSATSPWMTTSVIRTCILTVLLRLIS